MMKKKMKKFAGEDGSLVEMAQNALKNRSATDNLLQPTASGMLGGGLGRGMMAGGDGQINDVMVNAMTSGMRRPSPFNVRDEEIELAARKAMYGMKKGGSVKASKPKVSSASKRADGCAIKGKTKGRMV
jgi:hypothetical protein